ncbi:MAG: hypothetical protein E7239_10765 [Sarcina sp.]|nr:hypothetical protein [Sarcina sp.]MBE6001843.1 hypothetical protein [Sarcina sp.]
MRKVKYRSYKKKSGPGTALQTGHGYWNISILFLLVLLMMTGCGGTRTEPAAGGVGTGDGKMVNTDITGEKWEDNAMTGSDGYKQALAFMAEQYGLTAEELMGIDVERLIEDYQLDRMDYSAQEVREILEEQGDSYQLQLEDDIYALLGNINDIPASGTDLTPDADIVKIAFYENPGSLQRRMLFDLEDCLGFLDDAVPFELSAEQVGSLKQIAADAKISSWQHKYARSDEKETTGSYAWKMVFLLSDGRQCIYGGYTQDMTGLPADYNTVAETFRSIAE